MKLSKFSFLIVAVLVGIPVVVFAASEWSEPTASAPNNNVNGPVWLSPSSFQVGDAKLNGDIYFSQGKALRIDSNTSQTVLNLGNYGTNKAFSLSVRGDIVVHANSGEAGTSTGKIAAPQLCIGTDCRNAWPTGGGSGDLTEVQVGTGITVTNGTGPIPTIATDYTKTQARVASAGCAAGSSIRVIAQDGTVTCETDSTGSVTDVWVDTTGDTMTGALSMSSADISIKGGALHAKSSTNNNYAIMAYNPDSWSDALPVGAATISRGTNYGVYAVGDNKMGVYGWGLANGGGFIGFSGNGINATGTSAGVDAFGTDVGVYGKGAYGVVGYGSAYGGRFVNGVGETVELARASLNDGVFGQGDRYGVRGVGTTAGAEFDDYNGTGGAYIAYGSYSFYGTGSLYNAGALTVTGASSLSGTTVTGQLTATNASGYDFVGTGTLYNNGSTELAGRLIVSNPDTHGIILNNTSGNPVMAFQRSGAWVGDVGSNGASFYIDAPAGGYLYVRDGNGGGEMARFSSASSRIDGALTVSGATTLSGGVSGAVAATGAISGSNITATTLVQTYGSYNTYSTGNATLKLGGAAGDKFTIEAVSGGANCAVTPGSGTTPWWSCSSDRRLKKDISELSTGLDVILKLKPSNFVWKATGEKSVGFIAQEVQEVLPGVVTVLDDNNGYLGVSMEAMVPYMVKAIQELKEENDGLKARIEALEAK